MEQEHDCKEDSWKYVTVDEILSKVPCELIYAKLVGATAAGSAILWDGENNKGKKIVELNTGGLWNCEISPRCRVYCRRGLCITDIATCDGIFIQWRERPQTEGRK